MKTLININAKIALALGAVLLLGFTASARADGASAPGATNATEALTSAAASVAGSGAGSSESAPPGGAPTATNAGAADGASHESSAASGSDSSVAAVTEPKRDAAGAKSGEAPGGPSTTDVARLAQAAQEAITHASSKQPQKSGGGGEETLAAESNATSQLAWQVQIAQCSARCVGASQSQIAEQQNRTVQVVGRRPAKAGSDATLAAGGPSDASSAVRQIQIGCLAHCFGATTRTPAQALAGYWQAVESILRELAAGLDRLSPRAAIDSGLVEQTSYQSQIGAGEAPAQLQGVAQVSDNAQLQDSGAGSNAAPSGAPAQEIFNQTAQGIWQLQVGCLMFCRETTQYQQAEQSNKTTQAGLALPVSAASANASAADITTQLIWQAQIGCLFWCYDATERQVAREENVYTRIPGESAPAPAPSEPSAGAPAANGSPESPPPATPAAPPSIAPAAPLAPLGSSDPADPRPALRPLARHARRRHLRSARSRFAAGRAAGDLPSSAAPAQLSTRAQRIAIGAHIASQPPRAVFGSTVVTAGGASGSNVAGVAVVVVVALFGLCAACAALLLTRRRPSAASHEP